MESGITRRSYLTGFLHSVFHLGSGELLARVLGVSIVILLGHKYGVVIVGVYALAQSILGYLGALIDFGLRHIGARLVARFPCSVSEIMRRVQRRRMAMGAAVLPLVLFYVSFAHLPLNMKVFVFLFAGIGAMYALSLEWAAWGREQLRLVGLAKAIVPASVLVSLLLSFRGHHVLACMVLGNLVGYTAIALVFRIWWRRYRPELGVQQGDVADIGDALQWHRTSIMGLAWLGNMAFNTSDMLILGVLSDPQQLGLYNASYRIINQALLTYYLFTTVLYPRFARHDLAQRRRMLRPRIFLLLFASGLALAMLPALFRHPLLTIIFGRPFAAAAPLLLLLSFSIPLDFLVSYLSVAYFAWGMERKVLLSAAVAAAVNIAFNLATIPRYGAMAAAVNTLVSYVVYFCALVWTGRQAVGAPESSTADVSV